MKNFPNKFVSPADSIVGHMLTIVQNIPEEGIVLDLLKVKVDKYMDLSDYIDAMTGLYAIGKIEIMNNHIFTT